MGVVCHFHDIVSASIHMLICIFVVFQVRGVQYLHSLGIVHGDIKPENILLDIYDVPKLCDFGMSAMEGEVTQGFGTKPYMAPEIVVSQVVNTIKSSFMACRPFFIYFALLYVHMTLPTLF